MLNNADNYSIAFCVLLILMDYMVLLVDTADKEAENKQVFKRFEQQHIQKGGVAAPPTTRDSTKAYFTIT